MKVVKYFVDILGVYLLFDFLMMASALFWAPTLHHTCHLYKDFALSSSVLEPELFLVFHQEVLITLFLNFIPFSTINLWVAIFHWKSVLFDFNFIGRFRKWFLCDCTVLECFKNGLRH